MKEAFKYVKLGITIGWPLLAGAATLIGAYKAFLYENINENHLIHDNYEKIQKLEKNDNRLILNDKEIKVQLSNFNFKIEHIEDEVNDLLQNYKQIANYQQILRVEVKQLAEGKLNISEFWHYIDLEEHYVGNSK